MALAKATADKIQGLAARYPSKQSAIIPALWAAQYEQGYVTDEAMAEIAQLLELPPSLIEATASFYSLFLTKPEGRHDVVICVNSPCMLRGADEIVAYVHRTLGVRDGHTTPDGAITWHSTIECLGACGGAPMMQVDHRFEENLTSERVDAIFERLRKEPAPHDTSNPLPRPSPAVRGPREPASGVERGEGDGAAEGEAKAGAATPPAKKPAQPRGKRSQG